jgi:hypothetical protein
MNKILIPEFEIKVNSTDLLDCLSKASFYTQRCGKINNSVYHKDTLKGVLLNNTKTGSDVVANNFHMISVMKLKTENVGKSSLLIKTPYLALTGILEKNKNKIIRISSEAYSVENPGDNLSVSKDKMGVAKIFVRNKLVYETPTIQQKYVDYAGMLKRREAALKENFIKIKFNKVKLISILKSICRTRDKVIDENYITSGKNKVTISFDKEMSVILSRAEKEVVTEGELLCYPKEFITEYSRQPITRSFYCPYALCFLENYKTEFVILSLGESTNDAIQFSFDGFESHTNLMMGMYNN